MENGEVVVAVSRHRRKRAIVVYGGFASHEMIRGWVEREKRGDDVDFVIIGRKTKRAS